MFLEDRQERKNRNPNAVWHLEDDSDVRDDDAIEESSEEIPVIVEEYKGGGLPPL